MTVVPVASKVTVTPGMPGSPASWRPLLLVSFQTKSPRAAVWNMPASMEFGLACGEGDGIRLAGGHTGVAVIGGRVS